MKVKKIFILLFAVIFISFFIGLSFAYFTTIIIGNEDALSNSFKSAHLTMVYDGTNYLKMENAQPGDFASFSFSVTNTGRLTIPSYSIYFS